MPAFFSDAQRQATREAGEIAGLEVVRIINEPTAAALAYESRHDGARKALVYDLGGGTFDVSVVNLEGDVVEVLASHGNNHLGGDDFDRKIVDLALDHLKQAHGLDASQSTPPPWRGCSARRRRPRSRCRTGPTPPWPRSTCSSATVCRCTCRWRSRARTTRR